jgi:hypothetical protein
MMRRRSGKTSISDLIPETPAKPFEVVFDRTKVAVGTPNHSAPYPMVEIFTKNRVYLVDSNLTCIEVIERMTGDANLAHPLLRSRLVGGQRKHEASLHQTKPFPVPGMEAMFAVGGAAQTTSIVERVILHVRVTTVLLDPATTRTEATKAPDPAPKDPVRPRTKTRKGLG